MVEERAGLRCLSRMRCRQRQASSHCYSALMYGCSERSATKRYCLEVEVEMFGLCNCGFRRSRGGWRRALASVG